MKIEDLRTEKKGNRPRVAATVTWEDCDRPALDMYFETEEAFGDGLTCNPHAFLVGSVLPALHHGEKRVRIDADICPELKENLTTAMHWIRHWYYSQDRALVAIEAGTMRELPSGRAAGRTGFFFSGGIDCLATLRANRLNYPPEHPGSIKDGLLIYGQNVESDNRPETFAAACAEFSELVAEGGLVLVPVYTNVRLLDDSSQMFSVNHGAILGSVAHAFSRRLSSVCVSASDSIPGLRFVRSPILKPHGSHPLLDPCFSSSDLRIRHDGITMTRLDKTRLIAGWDTALRNIKVCGPNWPGRNCGRCEKCIRTMLELLAAGALDRAAAFPADDITKELVSLVHIKKSVFGYTIDDDYLELVEPLRQIGRPDLARAVEQAVKRAGKTKKGLATRVREIDRKYLSGVLSRTKTVMQLKKQGGRA